MFDIFSSYSRKLFKKFLFLFSRNIRVATLSGKFAKSQTNSHTFYKDEVNLFSLNPENLYFHNSALFLSLFLCLPSFTSPLKSNHIHFSNSAQFLCTYWKKTQKTCSFVSVSSNSSLNMLQFCYYQMIYAACLLMVLFIFLINYLCMDAFFWRKDLVSAQIIHVLLIYLWPVWVYFNISSFSLSLITSQCSW